MSKKKTPKQKQLHSEYMKQRRRIQSLVNKAKKRGYTWEKSPVGEIPKNITKREIEKLKRKTPEILYKEAKYFSLDKSSDYIAGTKGREIERKVAAKKGLETKKLKESNKYRPTPVEEIIESTIRAVLGDEHKEIEEVIESAISALEDAEYNELMKTGIKQDDILAEDYAEIVEEEEREFQGRKEETIPLDNEIYHEDTEPQRAKRKDVYEDDEDIPWKDLDQTNITLEYLEGEIARWTPQANWSEMLIPVKEADKNRLTVILQSAIAQSGRLEVAIRVEKSSEELKSLFDEILYASGSKEGNFKDGRTQVNADLARVTEILQGGTLTMAQAKALEKLLERNEDYS